VASPALLNSIHNAPASPIVVFVRMTHSPLVTDRNITSSLLL